MNYIEVLVQKKKNEETQDACERAGREILTGYIFAGAEDWIFEDPDDIEITADGAEDPDATASAGEGWNDLIRREAEKAKNDINSGPSFPLHDGRAIMALGDGIAWGSDYAVVTEETEAKVMLSKKDIENIRSHPERWCLALIYYPATLRI